MLMRWQAGTMTRTTMIERKCECVLHMKWWIAMGMHLISAGILMLEVVVSDWFFSDKIFVFKISSETWGIFCCYLNVIWSTALTKCFNQKQMMSFVLAHPISFFFAALLFLPISKYVCHKFFRGPNWQNDWFSRLIDSNKKKPRIPIDFLGFYR